ncbi:sugar nucleotide-binding protein [Pseudomonas silvicola]|nr:sugar nucleotide-binding protein [Pseudomonas silvicola]
MNDKTALVLGATGGIGSEMVRQLVAAGWRVRALHRHPPVSAGPVHWVAGDAMHREAVLAAARGCSVIVHAVNPAGYRGWGRLVLPMLENTVAAATAQAATVILPGTLYNFGPDSFAQLRENSPQRPHSRKGAIRVRMEQRLADATGQGVRVIIVRAGDFFGPSAGNNWFSQGLVKPGRQVSRVNVPGVVGHQWAYIPDVACTMMALLARRERLVPFAVYHMAGHWDADGQQMAQAIVRRVTWRGVRAPLVKRFPWWLVCLAAPFVETFRELWEMRYLWREPVRMGNERLLAELGAEPHTPLDEAIETTLLGLGCFPAEAP